MTFDSQGPSGVSRHGRAAGSPAGEPAARLADVCSRRATVYEALTMGFAEPTPALVAALVSGELVETLREAVAWFGPEAAVYDAALGLLQRAAGMPGDRLVELSVEHARLFTGPGQPAVMCYASQYLDADERGPGRLNGAAAAYAAAAYADQGVTVVPARGELADHVGLELEFLYHLCRVEEAAWTDGRDDDALATRRALDRFLREHGALWLAGFADAVRDATTDDLYLGLGALISAHLSVELGVVPVGGVAPAAGDESGRRLKPGG